MQALSSRLRDLHVKRIMWSRYLLSSHGYENPSVWAALGRYFSGCRQPGPEADEIVRNVLGALQLVPKIRGRARGWVMGAIVRPPWLTAEQQMEWKNLCDNLMKSSSTATLYLLELSPAGLAEPDDVKKTVLKRLENLDKMKDEKKAAAFIFELMRGLGRSERIRNFPVEMFHDVWVNLRQCSWWESPRVRVAAVEGLATCLKSNPVWRKNLPGPGLESLWLEILRGESHSLTIHALRGEQSEIMKICPGFCPDSIPIWKALGRSEDAYIRCTAWKFFISLGDEWKDETGAFLLERLREERNMDVLETMAQWKPSLGKPFPSGFLEGWTDCFQGVMAGILQSVASGQGDMELAKWEMEEIIHAVKAVILIRILNIAWLEERPGFDSQPAKPADLRAFWETLAETMKAFPDSEIIGGIETAREDLWSLFQLGESPEKFLDSFTRTTFNNFYYKNRMLWESLVEDLAGRDLSSLAVNVRHNLGVVVASLMARSGCITKETQQVFMELCGDGTWTPDRVPAGWERFCHEFRRICRETSQEDSKTGKIEEICEMIGVGYTIGDERCHELFRQTLCQVLESVNPVLASVLEGALWREIVRSAETAERLGPDGKGLDEAGQRRWLRQFMLAHGQTHGRGEDSQATGGFWNLLWTGLNPDLSSQAGTGVRPACRMKVSTLNSGRLVFLHPHRDRDGGQDAGDASQPVRESDRLVQMNSSPLATPHSPVWI